MALSKFAACTFATVTILAGAGCANGTGQALTPTLPSETGSAGTGIKASVPQPMSPRAAVRVANLTPQLTITNASLNSGVDVPLVYEFRVLDGNTVVIESGQIAAGNGQTSWSVPGNRLAINKAYTWQSRVTYNGVAGAWSETAEFMTPAPSPDGPVFCAGSTGPAIIACVAAKFPEKLEPTARGSGSDQRRKDNMDYIRDRIIETGRCMGFNLGRNFKRGTPEISHDFIVWREPGWPDRGVDIAQGFDDVDLPLRLHWSVFPGPDYGYPFYAGYPAVDCSYLR